MKAVKWFAAALILLALGCRFPWEPEFGPIVGTVRYLDGHAAFSVKVGIAGETPHLTDLNGRFRLEVPVGSDTVTVYAYDTCPIGLSCAETWWGLTKAVVRRGRVVADIVMDKASPI